MKFGIVKTYKAFCLSVTTPFYKFNAKDRSLKKNYVSYYAKFGKLFYYSYNIACTIYFFEKSVLKLVLL